MEAMRNLIGWMRKRRPRASVFEWQPLCFVPEGRKASSAKA
jgi:hypothetical protein